jgi:hypothetical protein
VDDGLVWVILRTGERWTLGQACLRAAEPTVDGDATLQRDTFIINPVTYPDLVASDGD